MPRVLGVIPARYASTRFPGKPLAPLGDSCLVHEVWSRASASEGIDRLVLATDDIRIEEAARAFGAEVMRTSTAHPSGTDRVAEVVERLDESYDIVINIQGDEPLLTGTSLDRLAEAFARSEETLIATLAEPIESSEELFNPNVVKVVTDGRGRALYFSRSPIPYHRASAPQTCDFRTSLAERTGGLRGYRKHQGIYAYTPRALTGLTRLRPSPLELDEGLEQLRALEAGYAIQVIESDFRSLAVDTPADLERVVKFLAEAD